MGSGKSECSLRPVGAIGAYAPEGMRKEDKGIDVRRQMTEEFVRNNKLKRHTVGNR